MKNKYILESLASDLKRVALGLHRGSNIMAQRFLLEARNRKMEIDTKEVAPYIIKLLNNLDKDVNAETALMYSVLIQNYTQNKKL